MADYGSSGIWVAEPCGPFRHGMISYSSLGLPTPLTTRFEAWIAHYWKRIDDPAAFDCQSFNATGRLLARDLKAFVGRDTRVLFVTEDPAGGLGPEEEVDAPVG
jgi:hypothetical protein